MYFALGVSVVDDGIREEGSDTIGNDCAMITPCIRLLYSCTACRPSEYKNGGQHAKVATRA
jgi:hypothetical protein